METPIFLDPNNPFIRKALQRQLGTADIPGENTGGKKGFAKDLAEKQKWKMLRKLPGSNSSNTWQAMSVLNKGLKQAGVNGSQQNPQPQKRTWREWGADKLLGEGTSETVKLLRDNKDNIRQGIDLYNTHKDSISKGLQFYEQHKDWADPEKWKGFLSQGVGSLSKLIGSGGEGILSLLQMLYNGMTGWGQQYHPKTTGYMNPHTGEGYVAQRYLDRMNRENDLNQIASTLQRKQGMANLNTAELLDIALQGSKQFHQKQASATDGNMIPDAITAGHTALSNAIKDVAAIARQEYADSQYFNMMDKAAEYVGQGFPATAACFAAAEANEKDAEVMCEIVGRCADDLLKRCVQKTYQRKVAEYKAAKAAAAK